MKAGIVQIIALAAIAFSCASVSAEKGVKIGSEAPGFTLKNHEGAAVSLNDFSGKYVVLEWINFDCPFVRKHYDPGNMQNLQKKYSELGAAWLLICSSGPGTQGHFSTAEIAKRLKKHDARPTAYLIDGDGKTGKRYDAKTTPHMYIINPEGVLIYNGAIDDNPSRDAADVKTANNYVAAALDAAMTGEPVEPSVTQPYGCSVKYSKK